MNSVLNKHWLVLTMNLLVYYDNFFFFQHYCRVLNSICTIKATSLRAFPYIYLNVICCVIALAIYCDTHTPIFLAILSRTFGAGLGVKMHIRWVLWAPLNTSINLNSLMFVWLQSAFSAGHSKQIARSWFPPVCRETLERTFRVKFKMHFTHKQRTNARRTGWTDVPINICSVTMNSHAVALSPMSVC